MKGIFRTLVTLAFLGAIGSFLCACGDAQYEAIRFGPGPDDGESEENFIEKNL